MSRPSVGAVAAALVVLVAAVAGTLAHRVVLEVGGLTLPIGLLVAVALLACTQACVVAAWPVPAVAVAGVVGWALATYAALSPGPGGDLLVADPGAPLSLLWLVGGAVALLAATVVTRRLVPRPLVDGPGVAG